MVTGAQGRFDQVHTFHRGRVDRPDLEQLLGAAAATPPALAERRLVWRTRRKKALLRTLGQARRW